MKYIKRYPFTTALLATLAFPALAYAEQQLTERVAVPLIVAGLKMALGG